MNRMLLIATYFDRKPKWLEFFWLAVSHNPTIDFLLFTDCISQPVPQNVRIVETSFESFVASCSDAIGVYVPPAKYHKIYDLRPTFGESLAREIAGFDYWGYVDLDIIFGDIRSFIDRAGAFDVLCVTPQCPMGHIAVFRNCEQINLAWRGGKNAIRYLNQDKGTPLDEVWFGKVLDALPLQHHKAQLVAAPKSRLDVVVWDCGRIFYQSREWIGYHFGPVRDAMTDFRFNPASELFTIEQSGMVSR